MVEQEFMREGSVQVTRSRIIIGSNTYPVNGITNINTQVIPAKRTGSILLGIIGFLALINGSGGAALLGLLLLGLAILSWVRAKPTYALVFGTAGADKQALTSTDGDFVARVSNAIAQALIARG